MTTTQKLPRWDMTVIFPSLQSLEFAQGFAHLKQAISDLTLLFEMHSIQSQPISTVDESVVATFETVVHRYNEVLEELKLIGVYINCFVSTNSHDSIAQARQSELQLALVQLTNLETRFVAWVGSLDAEALIERSVVAREHSYMLVKAKVRSEHLMSPVEEILATELNVSSGTAWSKLHNNLTSQLTLPIEVDGESRDLPMSMIRNLAYDADRVVRQRAYETEIAGWRQVAVPLAAALNSIKNEVNVLAQRRRWESPLAASLFANSIDRQTLDAMLAAARSSFPDFRRYLHIKARALGVERLAWYDLFAPLGTENKVWSFEEARSFIIEQFSGFSSRMGHFAARAFRENWVDAEPRPGKRDGAFCASLRGDESRVFANFKSAFGGMSTLAHELGHAYHNINLAKRTALQRNHPMTLAETASIFCETIIRHAALRNTDRQEQIAILEASLQGSCQVVVDITSRFLFEQGVFEQRTKRELSVDELNELMLQAQHDTYSNGLDEAVLHPYMWAVKGHYYSTARSFYNYPYMFGLLFGLGLYARYQQDPEQFAQGYDELLSSTGMADAAELASSFGIDIRSEAFWQSSLDLIRRDIDHFEALIG